MGDVGQPLIDEAVKKAAIAWLDGRAVWCAWLGDALYVISGPGEQSVELGDTVPVTLRGDHGGRIVTWPAAVTVVAPASPEWEQVAAQLAAKRLNATGGTAEVVSRWADGCTLYALRPAGEPTEAGTSLPADPLAEPPRPSPATRVTKRPFRLHRVRKPR
jgi:hypothetical protein